MVNQNFIPSKFRRSTSLNKLLSSRNFEVSDDISAILLALEAREVHLGLGDVRLRILEIIKQGLIAPGHMRVLVGGRVSVASG